MKFEVLFCVLRAAFLVRHSLGDGGCVLSLRHLFHIRQSPGFSRLRLPPVTARAPYRETGSRNEEYKGDQTENRIPDHGLNLTQPGVCGRISFRQTLPNGFCHPLGTFFNWIPDHQAVGVMSGMTEVSGCGSTFLRACNPKVYRRVIPAPGVFSLPHSPSALYTLHPALNLPSGDRLRFEVPFGLWALGFGLFQRPTPSHRKSRFAIMCSVLLTQGEICSGEDRPTMTAAIQGKQFQGKKRGGGKDATGG